MYIFIGDVYKENEKEFCYHPLMNGEILFSVSEVIKMMFYVYTLLFCLHFYDFW